VAQLIVRNLDPRIIQLLKQRAAARGHSAEEEHRRILQSALESEGLAGHLTSIPEVGEDEDFGRQADHHRMADQ
jgi:plasmid stability protein